MKFLANENVPYATIRKLQAVGLDVTAISFYTPSITDEEVMAIAIQEHRTIITFDRDYGTLIYRYGYRPPAGVIYLRLNNFLPETPADLLLSLLADPTFVFTGLFTVIDENSVR